jgi:hypothetical protein
MVLLTVATACGSPELPQLCAAHGNSEGQLLVSCFDRYSDQPYTDAIAFSQVIAGTSGLVDRWQYGEALHFTESDLPWVVNAYVLTFGGFLLLGGRMADLLGRRRVFMAGLVVFALASLAGGLASTSGQLIAARDRARRGTDELRRLHHLRGHHANRHCRADLRRSQRDTRREHQCQ